VFSDTNDPQTMDESKLADDDEEDAGDGEDYTNFTSLGVADPGDLTYNTVLVRSRYIPQRLNMRERKILRLVEAAMVCSGYTSMVSPPPPPPSSDPPALTLRSQVDGGGFKSETRRCQRQLQGITGVLHGLVMACNYEAGQALAESRNFEEYVRAERARGRARLLNLSRLRQERGAGGLARSGVGGGRQREKRAASLGGWRGPSAGEAGCFWRGPSAGEAGCFAHAPPPRSR
jgi:hypothetical protein